MDNQGPGPWFKMDSRDWLESTRDMPLEDRAAYVDVLCLIYERDGAIPDDDAWIAHKLHVSARRWRPIRGRLVAANKLFEVDGGLHNRRAQIEIERRANRRRINAENGASRGRKNGDHIAKTWSFNANGQQVAGVSPTESESDKDEKTRFYPVIVDTPRASAMSEAMRNTIVEWLTLAVPAMSPLRHARWLRTLVDRYGSDVAREAVARCRPMVEAGDVNVRAVHSYIETAARELANDSPAWGHA